MRRKIGIFAGVIALVLLCAAAIVSCRTRPSLNGTRAEELAYLKTIMPDSLLEYSNVDVVARKSIAIFGEGEGRYLGLHVYPGQKRLHGGIRAEVSVDYPFKQGDTVKYSWKFMLPEDFASDAPKNRWWLIGQWHDQPNKRHGETWKDFPSRSPPISIGVGELDGKAGISLAYGPTRDGLKQQAPGHTFLKRGQWYHITAVIHWSEQSDGKISLYLDDSAEPIIQAHGPNMNNDYQHFLSIGMYRHPEIATDNWIYLDDLTISPIEDSKEPRSDEDKRTRK